MMRFSSLIVSVAMAAAAGGALLSPCTARAEGRATTSVSLIAGYGATSSPGPNLAGPGIGFRAGHAFDVPLYVGALGLFSWGTRDEYGSERHHVQSLGLELGFEFRPSSLIVRPSLRSGASLVTTARDDNERFLSPHLGVGISLLIPQDAWFWGVDVDSRLYTRPVHNSDFHYGNLTLGAYGIVGLRW